MRRGNGGFFCAAVGMGLLIVVFCPIRVILVLAAVALVLYGLGCARK